MLSSFSHIPPGPVHLVRFIPQLVLPSFLLYASSKLGLKVPLAWLLPAVALATPGLYKALIWYKLWTVTRAAEKLGARVVPIVQRSSKELIQHAAKALKQGYPGILDEFAEGYGTVFGLRVLTETRIVTFEPEHVKAILASQFETFDKGHIFKSHMHSLFGNGVFNSDGDLWKFHRTLSRPFFSRERVNDHPNVLSTADKALRIASARLSEGHAFDLQDLAMRYTLDISTQFLLGNSVHSLDGGLAYPHSNSSPSSSAQLDKDPANAFGVALSEGTYLSADRSKYGAHWPLAEFWKDEVKARREVIDAFIEPHLKRVLKNVEEKRAPGSIDQADVEDQTLVECLARQTPDETLIKDELANFLIAGRDTTAATITFSVYMLSQYPVIAERVRKDVLSRLRGDEQPTPEDVKEMKYLRAFINEVLRLYPPVPYDSRMSNKATLWPSPTPGGKPFYVPAKSKILYSMWYMHRSTELWGPDALEFDPDRFLDDRLHKYLTPNPYMFIPFNAGPRICLGMQFAYNMSSIFLIRLLQRFENIRLALDAQPPGSLPPAEWATEDRPLDPRKAEERVSPKTSINMSVKGGLWVRMDEIKLEDQDDDFEFISLSKSRRL